MSELIPGRYFLIINVKSVFTSIYFFRYLIMRLFFFFFFFFSFVSFADIGTISSMPLNSNIASTRFGEALSRPPLTVRAYYIVNISQSPFKISMAGTRLCPLDKRKSIHPPIPANALAWEFIHPTQPNIPYCYMFMADDKFGLSLHIGYYINEFHVGNNQATSNNSQPPSVYAHTVSYGNGYVPTIDTNQSLVLYCDFYCRNQHYPVKIAFTNNEINKLYMNLVVSRNMKVVLAGPKGITPSGGVTTADSVSFDAINSVTYQDQDSMGRPIGTYALPAILYMSVPKIDSSTVPEVANKTCDISADFLKREATVSRFEPSKYIDFPVTSLTLDCSHTSVTAGSNDEYSLKLTKVVPPGLVNDKGVVIPFVPRKGVLPSFNGSDNCTSGPSIGTWLNDVTDSECILKINSNTGSLPGFGTTSGNKYKISLGADWSSLTSTPESGEYKATYILNVLYD